MYIKCGQSTCTKEATCAFDWPGSPTLASCEACAERAVGLASHFGYRLPIIRGVLFEAWVLEFAAKDSIERLKNWKEET